MDLGDNFIPIWVRLHSGSTGIPNWKPIYLRGELKMATIIVGLIVFALLGFIAYRTFFSKKKGGGCHSSACGSCPYACDKKEH